MITAVFDSIIVKPIELEKKKGNIIVPDTGKEKNLIGEIISIGAGKYSVTGDFMKTSLNVGDVVLLPSMGPVKLEFKGNEYYGCPETMVLAIIKNQ